MTTPTAAALYARISSDQEGTAAGVKRQLADCHAVAEREGWKVAEEYVDNDISAYSGKRRPAYERMLEDLRDGVRDAVIVYHQDRLTRNQMELEQFVELLRDAGVRDVRFAQGVAVDVTDGDGLVMLRIMGAIAANESATKSRRIQRKMVEVAAEGRPHGGSRRPFGFDEDRVTHRPDEADVVRTLVARFLAGESLRSLAVWLDDQGITTVYGKPWRTTTIRDMIANPRMAGLRAHNGTVVGTAVWEPIITEVEHAKVLAMIEQKRTSGRRAPRSYLLTGMLRCGKCGHTLFSSRRANSRRYVCLAGPDHRGCGRLTVVADPVEQLVADAVLYRLDTPEMADVIAGRAAQDEHTAALAESVAQDREQLDELAELYATKQINAREWMAARNPIEARMQDGERRLARATRNDAVAGFVGDGDALRAQWVDLNLTRQHAIVKAVLDHAVIAGTDKRSPVFDPNRVGLVWRV
ncbi:MAG: recombinase family protein [Ilumatobacteraceae bacterium]|nr:recombinase family protein [Ilumatobacteraceae bacterium]